MFVATVDTEHYYWQACGETADAARDALTAAWIAAGCDPEHGGEAGGWLEYYGCRVLEMTPGVGYRDGRAVV